MANGETTESNKGIRNMIEGLRVLALVPARRGSKRLPLKNIRLLNCKPLLAYSIEAANGCEYVDRCVVSTEDEEFAEIARRCGADVPFLRPMELASDTSKPMEYVMDCVERLESMGERFDVLCLLQPTSPLRTSDDVTGALEAFVANGRRGLVSVSKVSDHPMLMRVMGGSCEPGRSDEVQRLAFGTMSDEGSFSSLTPDNSTVRMQDVPDIVRVNGAVYVNMVSELSLSTSLNDNPVGYVIPREHAVDVDEQCDFDTAEGIMRRMR